MSGVRNIILQTGRIHCIDVESDDISPFSVLFEDKDVLDRRMPSGVKSLIPRVFSPERIADSVPLCVAEGGWFEKVMGIPI